MGPLFPKPPGLKPNSPSPLQSLVNPMCFLMSTCQIVPSFQFFPGVLGGLFCNQEILSQQPERAHDLECGAFIGMLGALGHPMSYRARRDMCMKMCAMHTHGMRSVQHDFGFAGFRSL